MLNNNTATYPHHICPPVKCLHHRTFIITALDIRDLLTCKYSQLPNLELTFQRADSTPASIWFRVEVVRTALRPGEDVWPFNFEVGVFDFAAQVAKDQGFTPMHSQSLAGKANRTAIKNLMHLLYNPWTSTHNSLDPAPAHRILRTTLPTTKLYAWSHSEKAPNFLKTKLLKGLYGYFKMGEQEGFFVLDALVGSIGIERGGVEISNPDELIKAHKEHLYVCWPFLKESGVTMKQFTSPVNDLFQLNDYTGMYIHSQKGKRV